MVRVIPFRAYRYDKSKVGDLSKVVSPPYDIIKGAKVDEYQGKSPYNIAWIIKNRPRDDDTRENNQYTRARDYLRKWIEEGVLKQDEEEAFYVYGQDFTLDGKDYFRYGFIGLIELEDFATEAPAEGPFTGVLQHEETLPKDIQDRLNLSRECLAQFGLIFVIYPDHDGGIDDVLRRNMEGDPIADVTDDTGVRHRIWAVTDDGDKEAITRHMSSRYVIIADGHHRYKTALALMKERPDLESARYRMVAFVSISNPGLVVLPTHRLVQNLDDFSAARLLAGVREHFDVHEFDTKDGMFALMSEQFENGGHAFGLYVGDGKFYCLVLKDVSVMDEALPDRSSEFRRLDVTILHTLVLDRILGIDKEKLAQGTMRGGGYVVYIKGIGDAVEESIKSVDGDAQAVFFMNPTRVEEVEAVSNNFECMPQKSTFFHPKVWSGFTINVL